MREAMWKVATFVCVAVLIAILTTVSIRGWQWAARAGAIAIETADRQ